MFAAAFTFMLAVTYAAAEIPSYIHVCGRRDPNIEQCILKNVENLKYKICEGIPELDIPRNDPLYLNELIIVDTVGTKMKLKNVTVTQLCDVEIKSFHADIEKLHFDFKLNFKQLKLNGTYDFDIHILVPIVHQGQVYISTDNVDATVIIDFNAITKNGKKYVYMSNIKLNLDLKSFVSKYNLDSEQLKQLYQIIDNFIGNNQQEVLNAFKPTIEEAISKIIIDISNNIVKHFTYEELFPDRT